LTAITRERIIAHDGKLNVEDTDAGWYVDHVLRAKQVIVNPASTAAGSSGVQRANACRARFGLSRDS
jgi:hypothetical protein